jgi:UDP-glucose 4-epimerase
VRDYIHVSDLADAHVLALRHLEGGGDSIALNLGSGRGHSVFEIIRAVEKATGRPVRHHLGPRRPGDPPVLLADPAMAGTLLGWTAKRNLTDIVSSAWNVDGEESGSLPEFATENEVTWLSRCCSRSLLLEAGSEAEGDAARRSDGIA